MALRSLMAPRLVAHAHCDIPCGIYDPTAAKIAADTVAKMIEKITGATGSDDASRNTYIRSIAVKEEHAQICKKELLILWTDYFKPKTPTNTPSPNDRSGKPRNPCSKTSKGSIPHRWA